MPQFSHELLTVTPSSLSSCLAEIHTECWTSDTSRRTTGLRRGRSLGLVFDLRRASVETLFSVCVKVVGNGPHRGDEAGDGGFDSGVAVAGVVELAMVRGVGVEKHCPRHCLIDLVSDLTHVR